MFDDDFMMPPMPGEGGFWQEPDFLLADIISGFVNRGGMELGITLFVKGMVITGTLTSEQEYLDALSEMFATQAKRTLVNPSKKDLKTAEEVFDFTSLAEDTDLEDQLDGDDIDPEDRQFPSIRYLHLKDPVIVQPSPAISFSHSQISILRLRLTMVDGWMVGKVTVDDEDELGPIPPIPPNNIRH